MWFNFLTIFAQLGGSYRSLFSVAPLAWVSWKFHFPVTTVVSADSEFNSNKNWKLNWSFLSIEIRSEHLLRPPCYVLYWNFLCSYNLGNFSSMRQMNGRVGIFIYIDVSISSGASQLGSGGHFVFSWNQDAKLAALLLMKNFLQVGKGLILSLLSIRKSFIIKLDICKSIWNQDAELAALLIMKKFFPPTHS